MGKEQQKRRKRFPDYVTAASGKSPFVRICFLQTDFRESKRCGKRRKNYKEWRRDKLNFLIVEDNVDMGSYISSMLNPYYNTIEAANGEEALTILRKHNIDFIISDLMMPVMDGLTLSKRVKESIELSHIPFLMLTAKSTEKARTESYRLGVDSYLVKPFSEEVLLARIQNILKARERYQKQLITRMDTSALELSEESKDKKFMENVLEIMKQNFQNSAFDVSDFAEAMNVSKSLLNKKLNALSGKSAGQFIRVYRLNLAYNLILHNKGTKTKPFPILLTKSDSTIRNILPAVSSGNSTLRQANC